MVPWYKWSILRNRRPNSCFAPSNIVKIVTFLFMVKFLDAIISWDLTGLIIFGLLLIFGFKCINIFRTLKFKKLNEGAKIPVQATKMSVGYDVFSCENITILPNTRAKVHSGIAMELPDIDMYGRIASRSGLSIKKLVDVQAGVIDCDYTDEICVILHNFSSEPFEIKMGDAIAQLIVEKVVDLNVKETQYITLTSRQGGFGSTS